MSACAPVSTVGVLEETMTGAAPTPAGSGAEVSEVVFRCSVRPDEEDDVDSNHFTHSSSALIHASQSDVISAAMGIFTTSVPESAREKVCMCEGRRRKIWDVRIE